MCREALILQSIEVAIQYTSYFFDCNAINKHEYHPPFHSLT